MKRAFNRRQGPLSQAARHGCGIEPLENRLLLFAVPIHIELTGEALPFLRTEAATAINAEQVIVDTVGAFDDSNHFDNCKFLESVANINEQLSEAVEDANPADLDPILAAANFGHALHTVEDFYAHSNWVNLGQTSLFDDSTGYWLNPMPYSLRDGVMIVQGPSPFGAGSVTRNGFSVTVDTGTAIYPGVVTGQFGLSPADCPPEAVIHHDELNKDSPDRPLHAEARSLAIEQVRHEFYRLVELVRQTYGTAEPLLEAWVKDDTASQQQLQELLAEESVSLGTVAADGTLTLNMGPAAAGRGPYVDSTDGDEAFTVTHVSGSPATGEVVIVGWNGQSQQFTIRSIAAAGGAGNDSLTLVGVQSPAAFDGGTGNDRLAIATAAGSVADTLAIAPQQITLNGAATKYAAIETLSADGGAGNDRFEVWGTSAATIVNLVGGGGDDRFVVDSNGAAAGGTVDGVVSKVTLDGGAGANTLLLEDSNDLSADVLTVTPTSIGGAADDTYFGTGGSIDYAAIEAVVINLPGGGSGDLVRLTPSPTTAFTINGNAPIKSGNRADILLIDVDGLGKYSKTKLGNDGGAWVFDGRQTVSFTGIEKVKKL